MTEKNSDLPWQAAVSLSSLLLFPDEPVPFRIAQDIGVSFIRADPEDEIRSLYLHDRSVDVYRLEPVAAVIPAE